MQTEERLQGDHPGYFPVLVPNYIKNNPDREFHFFIPNKDGGPKLACSFIRPNESPTSSDETLPPPAPPTPSCFNCFNHFRNILTDNVIDNSKPVIIICHGFQSWRNQMLLYHLASNLAEKLGYNTLRFDFPDQGHSTASTWTNNNEKSHDDPFRTLWVERVVKFVHKEMKCRVSCIIGHSRGARVAMTYALEREKEIKNNTIDPPSALFIASYVNLAGSFLPSLEKLECASLLTIHGDKDDVVTVENAYKINDSVAKHKLCILEGGQHNFNGLKYMNQIVTTIESFLHANATPR